MKSELVFIPAPGAGHVPPTLAIANLLLDQDDRIIITVIIFNFTGEQEYTTSTPRLRFVHIPCDGSAMALITHRPFINAFIEHHMPHVRKIIRLIAEDNSVRLAGVVLDMFCVDMTDVANEFRSPTYIYFTSGAATMGLMFHLQALRDEQGHDVTELKDSESKLSVPSYVNPVPAKVLPSVAFDKDGRSKMFLDSAKRFRESKGIMLNTFQELEMHGLASLSTIADVPPLFPVGPVLNLKNNPADDCNSDEIMTWLNGQPESSVVFLCFGSKGTFGEKQVKEMAVGIERSGHRFLWSLRRPPPDNYENLSEVLPEGFLDRTTSTGKVIGWAPQTAVLSHPSVGGFVSHCGWNSTLESIWCGVPMATLPLHAEQQVNAFQLVVELGLAAEIRNDYRTDLRQGGPEMIVTAEEIERGIKQLMSDEEMRKKVKEMKEKSMLAVTEGGPSQAAIRRFIDHVINNIP